MKQSCLRNKFLNTKTEMIENDITGDVTTA